ncbi:MAG: SHOCT domain-containing protein [Candidatus Marinimicrobia bacterium]|nr:SHOCT domain-containing protein [Candidatus Neomarinimicrobiota bacterium]
MKLIYMDAETLGDQITQLDKIRKQGLITDREFKRLKKRLLSQLGKLVPIRYRAVDLGQVLNELETLHRLVDEGVLTEKEYSSQKRRMLARL